jgi:hypothetical protein
MEKGDADLVMPSVFTLLRGNSESALHDAIASIRARDGEERSGASYFQASFRYRALAACAALDGLDIDRYHALLCKSALVGRQFRRSLSQGLPASPSYASASWNFALVDAVAAGATGLAVDVARLSPAAHDPRVEYEDDFLFMHYFGLKSLELWGGGQALDRGLFVRWRKVLDGGSDPHLDACEAIESADARALDDAICALILRRDAEFKKLKANLAIQPDVELVNRSIFFKGLGLLRLSDTLGIPTASEYRTVPRALRYAVGKPVPPADSWLDPDSGIGP